MSTIASVELLYAVIGATGGGVLGAIVNALFSRRKRIAETEHLEASADSMVVNAALQIADRLQVQLVRLEAKTRELSERNRQVRSELVDVRVHNVKMEQQIAKLTKENKALRTACDKLKAENEILTNKLDAQNP